MKKLGIGLGVLAFGFTLIACGGEQKKTDNYGNEVNEETAVKETPLYADFPLAELGKELFEGEGTCATCHKLDTKVVGPSLLDIAQAYKENKASIASFLNEESKPIVDPSQYTVMKANFAITKNMKPEERQALEQYIMSQVK